MTSNIDAAVKAIADELDGRERWILAWIERQVSTPYCEISGETLDQLVARGLVQIHESAMSRAYWPVVCSELGCRVGYYLRTVKTVIAREPQ
jgi:hypothetical protein